ncbi:hypothetical protein BDA96_10G164200 [Sorghum bicolor]|uniref:Uncharacterized protein n=1 Tax=Sorghum bicolor TaxID=4558 RepID=A0A921U0X2_SORBI|nr:hypothetical protein BDA96_10G164200 [Sorghum bicolor]
MSKESVEYFSCSDITRSMTRQRERPEVAARIYILYVHVYVCCRGMTIYKKVL